VRYRAYYKILTKGQKLAILEILRNGPRGTVMKLSRELGIPHQTLSDWKKKGTVEQGRYRKAGGGRK
jgi:hypothetical protein